MRQNLEMLKVVTTLVACFYLISWPASVAVASDNTTENSAIDNSLSSHCQAFENSDHYKNPVTSKTANPDNWIQLIAEASAGDEILLEDGIYEYDGYAVVIDKPLTIRGESKKPDNVIIQGRGYGDHAEGLMVMANDVRIADLTIKDIHHHAITIQEGFATTVVYNVRLFDIGTQHIKGNRPGRGGVIACSDIGYSNPVGKGDYNGGIDLHGAREWTIRDNNIFNIFGDGSGCVVDTECGTQHPGGGAGILIWQESENNTIERNTITESYRGILLGLNTPYSGGNVSNNIIQRRLTGRQGVNGIIEADAGISLIGADNVLVEGNSVILAGDYPGAIEVWKATGNVIKNNSISKPVWNRGEAAYNNCERPSSSKDCDTPEFGNILAENYLLLADNSSLSSYAELDNTIDNAAESTDKGSIRSATELENTKLAAVPQPGILTNDLLNKYERLLLDLREERLLMMADLLKFKEERLRLLEDDLKRREAEIVWREQAIDDTLRVIESNLNRQ